MPWVREGQWGQPVLQGRLVHVGALEMLALEGLLVSQGQLSGSLVSRVGKGTVSITIWSG